MYLRGTLSFDPSQMSEVKLVQPTKALGRLLNLLTLGLTSDKEEHETFTALSILSQLHQGLIATGIDNIVRLAKDGSDLYVDRKGEKADLGKAIEALERESSENNWSVFDDLSLDLEHEDDTYRYLIEIDIQRVHRVGRAPILITLNGVLKEFAHQEGESPSALRSRIEDSVFRSRESFEDFQKQAKRSFRTFLEQIEASIGDHLPVDKVRRTVEVRIVRPETKLTAPGAWRNEKRSENINHDPIFCLEDESWDASFLYAWLWAEICHKRSVKCFDCSVVDNEGDAAFWVGHEGFDAGVTATLDPSAAFEPPEGKVDWYPGHQWSEAEPAPKPDPEADAGEAAEGTEKPKSGRWAARFGKEGS